MNATNEAMQLRLAIEYQMSPDHIELCTQNLIGALGGRRDLVGTSPGAAALYIAALLALN